MPSIINTNTSSLQVMNQLNKTQSTLQTAIERLSSGKRVNSAKDNAAGIAIAERMLAQINGMSQGIRNSYDGVSMAQTAEGALATSTSTLQRMRELAIQGSNGTYSAQDRAAIQEEINQLASSLNDTASRTAFNGMNLFDGSTSSTMFQVGANPGETITLTLGNFTTSAFGNHVLESAAVNPGAGIAAGADFTISGESGSANFTNVGDSAQSVASAINAQSDQTGVTATASTEVNLGGLQTGQIYSFDLISKNGTAETVSFTVGGGVDGLQGAVDAFNQHSASTGVRAEVDKENGGLKLTNEKGENISLQASAGANAATMAAYGADGSLSAAVTVDDSAAVEAVGSVSLSSSGSFSVTENVALGGIALAGSSRLNAVSDIDMSTQAGAQDAISTIDAALDAVNRERSKYAAMMNRMEASINNLMVNRENTSAAKSRIIDADYAEEVANQSRSMLLQKIGIAMQSQANQKSQHVLSLLK